MRVFSKTDIGSVRQTNQDAYYTSMIGNDTCFAVVCDGMGGASAGNVASEMAVNTIERYVTRAYSGEMSFDERSQLLQNAVLSANIEVFEAAKRNPALSGMGTTVVTAIASPAGVTVCHVGDSRAYMVADGIIQLTRDHSVVQNLVESGELTPEEAQSHPKKNIITRALGVEENVLSDCVTAPFPENGKLLLCTDGLTNYASEEYINETLSAEKPENAAELLCNEAVRGGGGDNITAVVISNDQ